MALKQSRRCVSLSRLTMAKLQIFAESRDLAMSALVEYWVERGLSEQFDADVYARWDAQRMGVAYAANSRRPNGGRPIVQPEPGEPGQYAHLFGYKCRRCGARGHYAKTCQKAVAP